METDKIIKDYRALKQMYRPVEDMLHADPRSACLLDIINSKLDDIDKPIFLLYLGCGSYRELGKRFEVSHTTMRKQVLRIKAQIVEEYNRIYKTF